MAYFISLKTVVIGAIYPEIYRHIQRWSDDPPSSFLALPKLVWGWLSGTDWDRITGQSPWTSQKKPQWTTLIMIDSQAVKNTCNASIESKGFCFYASFAGGASPAKLAYKCTNGIKRHLAVDILGFPFFTHCTKASISDDKGLIEMLPLKHWLFQIQTRRPA